MSVLMSELLYLFFFWWWRGRCVNFGEGGRSVVYIVCMGKGEKTVGLRYITVYTTHTHETSNSIHPSIQFIFFPFIPPPYTPPSSYPVSENHPHLESEVKLGWEGKGR